jgi:uncharacterized protein with HEPN domain
MKDEVREHLEDILREASDIKEFTSGIIFEQYSKNRLLKAGVERKLEIIGEALNRIKSIDEYSLEKIREYRSIISFRNILAHGYDIIEDKVVWGIVENDLDILMADVKYLLAK